MMRQEVRIVIDLVRDGGRLCKGAGTQFFIEPSGKSIASQVAHDAIRSGLLRPCADGLFGDETSQTWVVADEKDEDTTMTQAEVIVDRLKELETFIASLSKTEKTQFFMDTIQDAQRLIGELEAESADHWLLERQRY